MAADSRRPSTPPSPRPARSMMPATTGTSESSSRSSSSSRAAIMNTFSRRNTPNATTPIHLTGPVTCQPLNVTWQHVGTPPYTVMVTVEQWTTDILQLPDSYLDGINANDTILYQHQIPSYNGNDGPTNPNLIVSVTDASGRMSNSSALLPVSTGTGSCAEADGGVDFYILIADGSTPSQCRPWSLSWQHLDSNPQGLVPPLSIFLIPSQEPPIAIRVPDSITKLRANGSVIDGSYAFTLPIRGQKRFLTTMSDRGPLGSGGVLGVTNPASDESSPDDCLSVSGMNKYARTLPNPTRTLNERPAIMPIINGSAKGIPVILSGVGPSATIGYVAYDIADSGAQTILHDNSGPANANAPGEGRGNGGGGGRIGGPLHIGGLIGVVLGAGIFAGALLATLAWLFIRARRKERRKRERQMRASAEMARSVAAAGKDHHHSGHGGGGGNSPAIGPAPLYHENGHGNGNGRGSANGTPQTEMRQMFSDAPAPTEELSPSSGAGAGFMSRLRPGSRTNHEMNNTDSFHSLQPLDPSSASAGMGMGIYHAGSIASMTNTTAPRTPGGYATDRSLSRRGGAGAGGGTQVGGAGVGGGGGDASPTSPASGAGSVPPFGRDSAGAGMGSPSDYNSGSWFPDPSLGTSSTRAGGGGGGTGTGTPSRSANNRPGTGGGGQQQQQQRSVVQHADAGLMIMDDEFDDEDGGQAVVELPPQYDSIGIRAGGGDVPSSGSPEAGAGTMAASRSQQGRGGNGNGNGSAPNSAGPNQSYFSGSSGGNGNGAGGGASWYPHSPTSASGHGSGSGSGSGSAVGTGESDLLMEHIGRSTAPAGTGTGSGGRLAGERGGGQQGSSSPRSSQPGTGSGAPLLPSTTSPLLGTGTGTGTGTTGSHGAPTSAGGSTSNEKDKRPKLKLATPSTTAASGLMEDLLRGSGAVPQYLAQTTTTRTSPALVQHEHNHPIDVGLAEPEEWETVPPEIMRRRRRRRRRDPNDVAQNSPRSGGGSVGTGTMGTGTGTGTSGGAGTTAVGLAAGVDQEEDGEEDEDDEFEEVDEDEEEGEEEQIPDESEFWIVPRG